MFKVLAGQANVKRYKKHCNDIIKLDTKYWRTKVVPGLIRLERKVDADDSITPAQKWAQMEQYAHEHLVYLKNKLRNN